MEPAFRHSPTDAYCEPRYEDQNLTAGLQFDGRKYGIQNCRARTPVAAQKFPSPQKYVFQDVAFQEFAFQHLLFRSLLFWSVSLLYAQAVNATSDDFARRLPVTVVAALVAVVIDVTQRSS